MNSFDYWFDYIVRNGEFVFPGLWEITINSYEYNGFFDDRLGKCKIIEAFFKFENGRDRGIEFCESNFNPYDELLVPLFSLRKII